MKEFSKKLLLADYLVAFALIAGYFLCIYINGNYAKDTIESMLSLGIDIAYTSVPQVYNLDGFGILLSTWIIQLGISSGAYYVMCKSDHKIQLPMRLINEMPEELKNQVDMTTIITTVLSTSDN